MYVYSPDKILPERLHEAEKILSSVRAKHAFITGSFLYGRTYKDIDVIVLSRSKKEYKHPDPRVDLHVLHPNQASSLFYHSATKLCVAKSALPRPRLRVSLTRYWGALNWCLTPLDGFNIEKETRDLVILTNYFEGRLLDSEELSRIRLRTQDEVDAYCRAHAPGIFHSHMKPSYFRRFFAGLGKYYAEAAPSIPALIRTIT